jgi:hypothetical protein
MSVRERFLVKKHLPEIAGLAAALGFVVFVIVFISRPSPPAPQNAPAPPSRPQVLPSESNIAIGPEFDPYMNPRKHNPYGRYTSEWTIDPAQCDLAMPGITAHKVANYCTVEIDRDRFEYVYGRAAVGDYDRTSPRNNDSLLVVNVKGLARVFTYDDKMTDQSRSLPDMAVFSTGFDATPFGVIEINTDFIDYN